ncbi:IclR family transcriptional regulator [Homoserinimonas aerilata]|uniref:IclR family transcriptional regulator n=1 Tax=Homoserinimonas aerilata TaxID=1162970 RepID=A0A542Y1M5_9MICO|nr:IclR family transcriptional regulator C-terminal domain-containing protein [Homoserinimonas aerilata]TQL41977.1 IclR family transcriptional regulator [Homoserinimonas aerilata]
MAAAPNAPVSRKNSSGLTRDVEILELLGDAEAFRNGGLTVTRIAEITGRDKAVISRALATLAASDIIERDEDTLNYRLGSRLYALAARTSQATLAAQSRTSLRHIAQSTRETTHLCVLRGGNVLTLISELSSHEFRTTGWEGITTAGWRTPSGRVLISDWDETSIAHWYNQHGRDRALLGPLDPALASAGFAVLDSPPADKAVVTDLASLMAEIDRIRTRGYALLDEELEIGVVGASAPVIDFTGRIVAAVNVSGPKSRIGHRLDALGSFVARAAAGLSASIGGPAVR